MSPSLGARWHHLLSRLKPVFGGPCMIYGYWRRDGIYLPHTRIASTAVIDAPEDLDIGDHVFIGHHNYIDASGGLAIGECCQITNHVSILTHSSHRALRVLGPDYFGHPAPPGYISAPTVIGERVFIGPHTVIAPGSRIGDGAVIKAFSYVRGEVPTSAVVGPVEAGRPAMRVMPIP